MKQLILIIITILFYSYCLKSQNLVLNSSFENHKFDKCINNLGGFNYSIQDWSIPNQGSTDFFDTCSQLIGINNYNGSQIPKHGTSYAGMYFYTDNNYREYVQGQLFKTLEKGKTYKMKFYLSLAEKSSYALKDIQVLVTEEKLIPCYHSNKCEKVIVPPKVTKGKFKMYSSSEKIYFTDKDNWQAFTFEFTAEGYESFFSIGNFNKNSKTNKLQVLSDSPYFFSYYYIDEVSIVLLEQKESYEPAKIQIDSAILIDKIYTFKNVLFDFNKSELLHFSIEELNQLFNHLNTQTQLKIEIYGHTDNMGLDKRNKELSEQRAKAVADYLISQGIETGRIKFQGFGSSQPISSNETEKGRQQNRRVEFKLIDN